MVLICGISSSGKTTIAHKMSGDVVAWDSFIGGGIAKTDQCNRKAAGMRNAVVEGIYIRKWMRESLCAACKGRKICIWLDTPLEECIARERADRCRGDSFIESQAARFEPPTYDEGWDEIIRITEGE